MATLYLELYDDREGAEMARWRTVGTLDPGERPGSVSHNAPQGRQIYMYGLDRDGRMATISVAPFGDGAALADARRGSIVRTLGPGEAHEVEIVSDVGRKRQRVRFRLEGDGNHEHSPGRTKGG